MTELVSLIENKMNISISKLRIPYWLGMLAGYGFDLIALITRKKLSISSVRIKKFCATTQFDASNAHSVFSSPFSLKEGLHKTLEYDFINSKANDDVVFFSE